jgi:L-threonylcarbamoyladenylate synthase
VDTHTRIRTLDAQQPDPAILAEAAALLRAGQLVAFPTETVYGLGADALNAEAVQRIYWAKGRPSHNPLIVHLADAADLPRVAASIPAAARLLAQHFWPGPLTLVLPRANRLPAIVTAGGPTVAVRVPAHPVARRLIQTAQTPIAAPSANRSGALSPTRAEHVAAGLAGRVALILDAGPTPQGIESTVVDLTGPVARVLRPGPISQPMLEAVLGQPVAHGAEPLAHGAEPVALGAEPLRSPGLLARHYAPQTRLVVVEAGDRPQAEQWAGPTVGWLGFGGKPQGSFAVVVSLPEQPEAAASQLYDRLHELDSLGLSAIVAVLPPDEPAWAGVRDRLRRAGTPA